MSTRRTRRSVGKRRLDREARRIVPAVLELSAAGYSTSTIASSTGVSVEGVRWILERERVEREARGGHAVGGGEGRSYWPDAPS